MKTLLYSLTAITFLTACESKAGTGALVGAGVGAAAGALISPTVGGVLIGTAAGAATGAIIGAALDSSDRQNLQENSPETLDRVDAKAPLTLSDIEKMTQLGISDDKIIGTIESTNSVYYLTPKDIEDLKKAGVSDRVIDFMIKTGEK